MAKQRNLQMRIVQGFLCTALVLAVSFVPGVQAAPLEPEACSALKTELQGLLSTGAKSDMDRGPDWAKANLAPDKMAKIERLIAVEEQLSFRCGEQVTARPALKELPKPEGAPAVAMSADGKGQLSRIPPPIRKDAAKAAKN
jgi:hypothetical protein